MFGYYWILLGAKINKAKIPSGWRILFERISSKLSISTNMSSVTDNNYYYYRKVGERYYYNYIIISD